MNSMDSVDTTFAEYTHAYRRHEGRVDAGGYLGRVAGSERRELTALIDGYLARRPRRPFDAEAFAGSHAAAVSDSLHHALHGRAGMWPVVLPMLRKQAGLSRDDLVPRLADALGAANEKAKVGAYYAEMEHGALEAGGVSDRVLTALAEIVDTTPGALRATGRIAGLDQAWDTPADPSGTADETPESPRDGADHIWDEVDKLFHRTQ